MKFSASPLKKSSHAHDSHFAYPSSQHLPLFSNRRSPAVAARTRPSTLNPCSLHPAARTGVPLRHWSLLFDPRPTEAEFSLRALKVSIRCVLDL